MMKNVIHRFICLCLLFGLNAVETRMISAAEPKSLDRSIKDPVVISLRPSLQTDSRVIRLVDVATISGGDSALRERLKQMDIEDSLSPGESITILPPQIEFRVRIAGIDPERISIRGSETRITAREAGKAREMNGERSSAPNSEASTFGGKVPRPTDYGSISFDEGPLEREIIQSAKDCVLNKLPWPSEDVECRLLLPLGAEIRRAESAAGYECFAELRTQGSPVGRVQVRVKAEGTRLPPFDVLVNLEVRHFDQVVLASKAIDRGHVITAADLYTDRQDVTESNEYSSKVEDLVGAKARRPIRALTPVRMLDVEAKARVNSEILIKRRDQVKMIARLGNLSVTAMGEALQEGRQGELIRLRNIESNATIQGRVIGPGEVDISF